MFSPTLIPVILLVSICCTQGASAARFSSRDHGQSLREETGDVNSPTRLLTIPILPSVHDSPDHTSRSEGEPAVFRTGFVHILEEESSNDKEDSNSEFTGPSDAVTKHPWAITILLLSLTVICIAAIVYYLHSTNRLPSQSTLPFSTSDTISLIYDIPRHIPLALTTIHVPDFLKSSRHTYTPLSSSTRSKRRTGKGSRGFGGVHESRLVRWALESDPDGLDYEGPQELEVELGDAHEFGQTEEMVNATASASLSKSGRSKRSPLAGVQWFSVNAPSPKTMRAFFGRPGRNSRRGPLAHGGSGDEDVVLWDLEVEGGQRGEETPLVLDSAAPRGYGTASF